MARLSNYVIDTEITDENQNMLVHGYTGAIDIIDRELANYLKNNKDTLERGTFPFGEENYDLLNKRGYISCPLHLGQPHPMARASRLGGSRLEI